MGRDITNAKKKYERRGDLAGALRGEAGERGRSGHPGDPAGSGSRVMTTTSPEWTIDEHGALIETRFAELPLVSRGKVRDVYDLGDRLLIVATDRISAFDWVLPTGIPDKGRVLTQLCALLVRPGSSVPNHLLGTDLARRSAGCPRRTDATARRPQHARAQDRGRARSSASSAATSSGSGLEGVPADGRGLRHPAAGRACSESEQLPEPIFTPATKEETGHDENISFERDGRDRRPRRRPRSCAAAASTSTAAAREYAREQRHHHRRHEVRVRAGCRRRDRS